MGIVLQWLGSLAGGLWLTLALTLQIVVASTLIGIGGGLTLLHGPRPARLLVRGYVDFVRGIPMLVLIFMVFYGVGALNLSLEGPTAAAIALSVFAGAHMSEIVRGGIGSLPAGQLEAAKMLGLTTFQRFRLIVLPLALPRMMPSYANTIVEILKGTALASLVGVTEFLYMIQSAVGTTFEPIPFYVFGAAVYFIFAFGLSQLAAAVERHYRYVEY